MNKSRSEGSVFYYMRSDNVFMQIYKILLFLCNILMIVLRY